MLAACDKQIVVNARSVVSDPHISRNYQAKPLNYESGAGFKVAMLLPAVIPQNAREQTGSDVCNQTRTLHLFGHGFSAACRTARKPAFL